MTVQELFVNPENQQKQPVLMTVWYKNGPPVASETPIPVAHDAEQNLFYEEASTLGFNGWPIKVMFCTSSDEYVFQLSNPAYEDKELIWVDYSGLNTRAKLRVLND